MRPLPIFEETQHHVTPTASAPPPPLSLTHVDCDPCCDIGAISDNNKRKQTPDLLELSQKYETIHKQTVSR